MKKLTLLFLLFHSYSIVFSQCNQLYHLVDGNTITFFDYNGKPVKGPFQLAINFKQYDKVYNYKTDEAYNQLASKIAVVKDGKTGIINDKGDFILDYLDIELDWFALNAFVDNLQIKKNDKYGLMNRKGEFILPIEYESINDYGRFIILKKDGLTGLSDSLGKIIVPCEFDEITSQGFADYYLLKKNSVYGLFNPRKNKMVFELDKQWIENIYTYDYSQQYYKIMIDNRYGIYDQMQNMIVEPKYSAIESISPHLWKASINSRYGIVNSITHKEIISCIYDNVYPFGQPGEGIYEVVFMGYYGLVDTNNTKLLPAIYDHIDENGIVRIGDKYGLFILKTKELIDPDYTKIELIYDQNKPFYLLQKDDEIMILDSTGGITFKCPGTEAKIVQYDRPFLTITQNSISSLYNFITAKKADFAFDQLGEIIGQSIIFQYKGKWGIYFNNSPIKKVEARFDEIFSAGGNFLVQENNKWGLMGKDGAVLINPTYDEINSLENIFFYGYKHNSQDLPNFYNAGKLGGCYMVKNNDKWGLINDSGQAIIPIEYDELELEWMGVLRGVKNGEANFINLANQIIYPKKLAKGYQLTNFYPFDSTFSIQKNDFVGLCNWKGKILLPAKFNDITTFDDFGLAYVKQKGKIGLINIKGKLIVPCKYDKIGVFDSNGIAKMELEGNVGFINTKGKILIPLASPFVSKYEHCMGVIEMNEVPLGYVDTLGQINIQVASRNLNIFLESNDDITNAICINPQLESITLIGGEVSPHIELPECFYQLPNLKTIIFNRINLDSISGQIKNLKQLNYFNLEGNLNNLPKEIGELNKLDTFIVFVNSINVNYERTEFKFPQEFAQLKSLRYLETSSHLIPAMPFLTSLTLRNDSIPDSLASFTNLKKLNVANVNFTSLPESILKLTNLEYLSLGADYFSEFPTNLEPLKKLQELFIVSSSLYSIDGSIGQLPLLKNLLISCNYIEKLPIEMANCSLLDSLILPSISNTTSLEVLTQLPKLSHLQISANYIPKLPQLKSLRIACDSLPENIQFATNLEYLSFEKSNGYAPIQPTSAVFFNSLSNFSKLQHIEISSWNGGSYLEFFLKQLIENADNINRMPSLKKITFPSVMKGNGILELKQALPKIEIIILKDSW